jgi:hypothetical protein
MLKTIAAEEHAMRAGESEGLGREEVRAMIDDE